MTDLGEAGGAEDAAAADVEPSPGDLLQLASLAGRILTPGVIAAPVMRSPYSTVRIRAGG
jgi:hypothetical protein